MVVVTAVQTELMVLTVLLITEVVEGVEVELLAGQVPLLEVTAVLA
jgi:hypothetical protein